MLFRKPFAAPLLIAALLTLGAGGRAPLPPTPIAEAASSPPRAELSPEEWAVIRDQLPTLESPASPDIATQVISTHLAKLSIGTNGDAFGLGVAIYGDTAVIGAPFVEGEDAINVGAAYVFERNQGGPNAWGLVATLVPSDGAQEDYFGRGLAVYSDTIVIGSETADVGTRADAGAAYVYERDAGGPNAWGEVAKLTASDGAAGDYFGRAVSISGDTLVIGAWGDENFVGSAYVFYRDQGGSGAWGQVTRILASDSSPILYFGRDVAISGDTIVVGAWADDDFGISSGSAYLFDRHQGGPDNWGEVKKILASDGQQGDEFGRSVAISGGTVVVGAEKHDMEIGAVYVYERDSGGINNWGETHQLAPSDGLIQDRFGHEVAISGDVVAAGSAMIDTGTLTNTGSVYVYGRDYGGTDYWGEVAKFIADDAASEDQLGLVVDVSGDTVVGGAWGDDFDVNLEQGSAYLFSASALSLGQSVSNPTPRPGELISYTIGLTNLSPFTSTNVTLLDVLPIGLTFAGPITVDPPDAGAIGPLPTLVSGVTLAPGQLLTVTLPVAINLDVAHGTSITHTVTATSTEITTPTQASLVVVVSTAPPDAVDDAFSTVEDTPAVIAPLANDSGPSGALSLSAVGTPAHGSAGISGTQIVYTPALNFYGADVFTYTASDGSQTDTATVTFDVTPVNDSPQAVDDYVTTPESQQAVINVLSNDPDAEDDSLGIVEVSPPLVGSVNFTNVVIVYVPPPDFVGLVTFTYTVSDGELSDTATVTVAVTGLLKMYLPVLTQ